MKILLTGVTGYIAQRLLPILLDAGHELYCCVRDSNRFNNSKYPHGKIQLIEIDFLKINSEVNLPFDIEVAYYLMHSMSSEGNDFESKEMLCASNFKNLLEKTNATQLIYLSGIVNEKQLSKHLQSRKQVELLLQSKHYALTTLRAGIIVGSGSASFEIIRDLVEKLPLMITPRWLNTKTQPIAIRNVLSYLVGVIQLKMTYNNSFDIAGPEVLSYKEMLYKYAEVRGLKRWIFTIPVMTPKLSSYWLYFVTSTSYPLAINLVDSMKVEVIARPNDLAKLLSIELLSYTEAIKLAFDKIEQQQILSSWKDALSSNTLKGGISAVINVPENGVYKDIRIKKIKDVNHTLNKIWSIGGNRGWYCANGLWRLRGFIDKIFGGVGMRRGRTNDIDLDVGDALDFWRVLFASKKEKRLLLYAEMKLPGEAWLEFKINEKNELIQTATFRPLGVLGRMYWFAVLPFHGFIFRGMLNALDK
jgi:uncharacterized protein YbjT (DUF2867 family)